MLYIFLFPWKHFSYPPKRLENIYENMWRKREMRRIPAGSKKTLCNGIRLFHGPCHQALSYGTNKYRKIIQNIIKYLFHKK